MWHLADLGCFTNRRGEKLEEVGRICQGRGLGFRVEIAQAAERVNQQKAASHQVSVDEVHAPRQLGEVRWSR